MKYIKKSLALVISLVLLCGCFTVSSQGYYLTSPEQWNSFWTEYQDDGSAAYMSPGSDETERNFSWYSPLDDGKCYVEISSLPTMSGSVKFYGTYIKTPEGDRSNKVTVTGLSLGETYFYRCCTDKKQGDVNSFTTVSGTDFSAFYTTDIHISVSDENENEIRNRSYKLNHALELAKTQRNISLLLSAGDQASAARRDEYIGAVASPIFDSIPFALTIGNHDRKDVNYKYFSNNPNEYKDCITSSYVGYDYWFVKGDVLFFMMDSNNGSAADHRNFVRQAISKNPDVKWRVAVFHHDLYGGRIEKRESENELLRLIWSPIFDEFKIDLALLGHSHYYTISNVVYDNKTVTSTADTDSVTNPAGTICMVSGSINNPRSDENPPLGENAGQSYLTTESIYNIIDFSEDSITINSYTSESGLFNTFSISKESQDGGHPDYRVSFSDLFVRFIGTVYAYFDNLFNKIEYFI